MCSGASTEEHKIAFLQVLYKKTFLMSDFRSLRGGVLYMSILIADVLVGNALQG